MTQESSSYIVRDGKPDDINLIYSSWLKGLYYGESWFTLTPKNAFMTNYHRIIELILSRPNTTVKVACLKDEPDEILGYSVYNRSTLHFVFVKKPYRKIGVAKSLVPNDIKVVTHLTKIGLSIIRNKAIEFNPFLTSQE